MTLPPPKKHGRRLSIARQAAIAAGAKTYLGKPCNHGHRGERRVGSMKCIDCDREQKRAETASGYWNAYHSWWRRTHDPNRVRQRAWEATYRTRHALQLEIKAQEKIAIRQNTINILYGGS